MASTFFKEVGGGFSAILSFGLFSILLGSVSTFPGRLSPLLATLCLCTLGFVETFATGCPGWLIVFAIEWLADLQKETRFQKHLAEK